MAFDVAAESYDQFMGRYSRLLSAQLADMAGVSAGQRVLDVGCGPGALSSELVSRVGAALVSAVDPSESFVAAFQTRHLDVDVRRSSAEELPYADATFDVALAQLVVQFMSDPVRGLAEMARVTRRGGLVAANVWDHGGGNGPLSVFWRAARDLDPGVPDESSMAGVREGDLERLFAEAGLRAIEAAIQSADLEYATFDEWWRPFTMGVGPAGQYTAGLAPERQAALRERCRELVGPEPFVIVARAWAARGVVERS